MKSIFQNKDQLPAVKCLSTKLKIRVLHLHSQAKELMEFGMCFLNEPMFDL